MPAAAVIRRGQALFEKTGRKGLLDGLKTVICKRFWLLQNLINKTFKLRVING